MFNLLLYFRKLDMCIKDIKEVFVFHTETEADLIDNEEVINHLMRCGHDVLFVRQCHETEAATQEKLIKELNNPRHCLVRIQDANIMIFNRRSIGSMLEKRGLKAIGFFGAKPEYMVKPPPKADVKLRIARICSKCESVISEKVNMVTSDIAEQVHGQYKDDSDADVSKTDKRVNINISDMCPMGC